MGFGGCRVENHSMQLAVSWLPAQVGGSCGPCIDPHRQQPGSPGSCPIVHHLPAFSGCLPFITFLLTRQSRSRFSHHSLNLFFFLFFLPRSTLASNGSSQNLARIRVASAACRRLQPLQPLPGPRLIGSGAIKRGAWDRETNPRRCAKKAWPCLASRLHGVSFHGPRGHVDDASLAPPTSMIANKFGSSSRNPRLPWQDDQVRARRCLHSHRWHRSSSMPGPIHLCTVAIPDCCSSE